MGFDDERPYGDFANQKKGKDFLLRKIDFMQSMNERFDSVQVPRTHFLLASYLEAARSIIGDKVLHEIYPCENPLLDLQQHTYSHGIIEALHGVDRSVMTADDYVNDVARASELMKDILGVDPKGLRTPYGYETDFSRYTDVLQRLQEIGIWYISSDLGIKATLDGAMTSERQPHTYGHVGFPGMVEVPAHGLQDVVYTKEKAKQLFGREEAPSAEDAFDHYDSVLDIAKRISTEPVSVALCLHPWAAMEYDPNGQLLMKIVDSARRKGFEILSYTQVADETRACGITYLPLE